MSRWFRLALFVAIIGVSKAHGLIKLIILAALGLAGLWMVHTLAQDYQSITASHGGNSREGIETEQKFYAKRSINGQYGYGNDAGELQMPKIDWERVLSRDPASCARSFICQLEAQPDEQLSTEEMNILNLIRHSSEKDSWASKQLQNALKNGSKVSSPVECRKLYKFCPYSSRMMMNLLKFFGGR